MPFTAVDLCEIIQSCGKAGVLRFEYHDIVVDFSGAAKQKTGIFSDPDFRPKSELVEEKKGLPNKVVNSIEDELTELLLTDPAAYESAMIAMENDSTNAQ